MENLPALSYSSLSKFNQCSLQFARLKAIEGREPDYNENNARGTIIHRFMETVINDRIQQGKWMKEADGADLMDDLWQHGFATSEDDTLNILEAPGIWNEQFLEKSIKDSMLLVPQIWEEVLPVLNPVKAEAYKRIPLTHPGKTYKELHGVIDLINNPSNIIDWKTSTRPRRVGMSEYDIQATVYAALSEMVRVDVHFVVFVYLKRDDPRIEWDTTKRDQRHIDWLQEFYLPRVNKQIDNEIYPPTPGWHCEYCPVPCGVNPSIGGWDAD